MSYIFVHAEMSNDSSAQYEPPDKPLQRTVTGRRLRGASAPFHSALAARDYLREHRDAAKEYADLKRDLASRYRFDRESYTDAKEPFVRRIVESARAQLRPSG